MRDECDNTSIAEQAGDLCCWDVSVLQPDFIVKKKNGVRSTTYRLGSAWHASVYQLNSAIIGVWSLGLSMSRVFLSM